MFPRLLLLTLALACAGCDILDLLGIDPNETLELPRPALDRRLWKNSLEDPQHLAGLRVELTSSVNRTFTAEDLPVRPFGIAARGQVIADVSLVVDHAVIAEGRASWRLRPDIEWQLRFYRGTENPAPHNPPGEFSDTPNYCDWPTCEGYWRIEIGEDHRNTEDEALWIVVTRSIPCPEGHLC